MFPPAQAGVITYAGWTTYALAPQWFDGLTMQGGFSAGGRTTAGRRLGKGDMPRVEQGFNLFLARTRSHLVVSKTSLMIDCRIDIYVMWNIVKAPAMLRTSHA